MKDRREEILDIIKNVPGSSGAMIHRELVKRSRAAKWFGEDSILAELFGVSLGGLYPSLMRLESQDLIRGQWVPGPYPKRRIYFATEALPQAERST